MTEVESEDGTLIAYAQIGYGPVPLVMVHGVLDTGRSWVPVAEALSEHCSCFVMDRRGRGGSEVGNEYRFESEIEDIEAVLRVAGAGAALLGHSSGGIYALEVARRTPLAGLIVYEPPLHYRGFDAVVDRIRALIVEGRLDDAAATFFTDEAGMSEREIAAFRQAPFWPKIAQLAPTLVREWDAIFAVGPTVARYRDVSVPTLLLTGSENVRHPSFATADLDRCLADARIASFDGQGHTANLEVPELVADRIARFLVDVAASRIR